MAHYRNKYLDYIKRHLSNYDYVLIVDMDLGAGEYSDNGILHSLSFDSWDMIAINGRTGIVGTYGLKTKMYDSLAFALKEDDLYDNSRVKLLSLYKTMNDVVDTRIEDDEENETTNLVPVVSAFNGLGLYKTTSMLSSAYSDKTKCEHSDLHKGMIDAGYSGIFINPYFLGYFPRQGSY